MTSPVEPVAPAPQALPHVPPVEPPWSKGAIVAAVFVATPLITIGCLVLAKHFDIRVFDERHGTGGRNDLAIAAMLWVLLGMPLVGGIVGGRVLKRLRAIVEDVRPRGLGLAHAARTGGYALFFSVIVVSCLSMTVMRGRQLRKRGRPQLARLVDGTHRWSAPPPSAHERTLEGARVDDEHSRAAQAWRHNGLTEHASVAAFSRLALDLMAVGAPAALVAACQRDALDEVRHTALCFELAHALDGAHASPGPLPAARALSLRLPWRRARLAQLAVDGFIEGALLEGTAAALAVQLARRADGAIPCRGFGGAIRATLAEIARDEARHAQHGWDVVRWCVDEGGAPVLAALHAAARRLDRRNLEDAASELIRGFDEDELDGALERFGIAGRALQDKVYARVREDVVNTLAQLLVTDEAALPAA